MKLPEERYRASFNRCIRALKESLPIERYAGEITLLKRSSATSFRGSCPVHGGDNTSSFLVRLDTGRAQCFSCGFYGDVLDLFMFVEGYDENQKAFAIVELSERYGLELPSRPTSWFEKNVRQRTTREAIRQCKIQILRRRLFKVVMLPLIRSVTSLEDHDSEVSEAWREFQSVPVGMLLNDLEKEEPE